MAETSCTSHRSPTTTRVKTDAFCFVLFCFVLFCFVLFRFVLFCFCFCFVRASGRRCYSARAFSRCHACAGRPVALLCARLIPFDQRYLGRLVPSFPRFKSQLGRVLAIAFSVLYFLVSVLYCVGVLYCCCTAPGFVTFVLKSRVHRAPDSMQARRLPPSANMS